MKSVRLVLDIKCINVDLFVNILFCFKNSKLEIVKNLKKNTATAHVNSRINNCEQVSKEDSCGKSHQNLKSWCHEDLPAVLLLEHF